MNGSFPVRTKQNDKLPLETNHSDVSQIYNKTTAFDTAISCSQINGGIRSFVGKAS